MLFAENKEGDEDKEEEVDEATEAYWAFVVETERLWVVFTAENVEADPDVSDIWLIFSFNLLMF